jgi:hypothetical protein
VAKVSEMIVSKFLAKSDFEEDQVCTIKSVGVEEVAQGETKWVMYFKEHLKPMVLNVTSIRVLEQAFGDDSDHWIGNKVMVYVDPNVSFQGRVVGGLRLRPPKKGPKPPVMPPPKTETDDEFSDDIPF